MRDRDSLLLESLYNDVLLNEAFDTLGAGTKEIKPEELIAYLNRVIVKQGLTDKEKRELKKKQPGKGKDYFHMPHIHGSVAKRVLIQTPEGEKIDLEKFKELIMQRPDAIIAQNDKMKKSSTDKVVFYNTTLPALKGLVVNEDNGEFHIINTCPSAGNCQLVCYAKHNNYQ